MTLFGGRAPFHGTNPLAFAAPSGGARPWLIDMATSSISFNRVLLYRVLGNGLPPAVAADAEGAPTRDPNEVRMLLPLGGADFGFKGAALAGVATVLSAVLQGATLDHAMIPALVGGADMATPRGMGQFCLAIDPAFFGGREVFESGMRGLSRGAARVAGARGRRGHGAGRPRVAGRGGAGAGQGFRSIRRPRRSWGSDHSVRMRRLGQLFNTNVLPCFRFNQFSRTGTSVPPPAGDFGWRMGKNSAGRRARGLRKRRGIG